MSVIWTPLRLMIMDDRDGGSRSPSGGSPRIPSYTNGEISSVTVRETTAEGIVRERARILQSISPERNLLTEEELRLRRAGPGSTSSLGRSSPGQRNIYSSLQTRPRNLEVKTLFTTATVESPQEVRKESSFITRQPLKRMADAQTGTEDLPFSSPPVSVSTSTSSLTVITKETTAPPLPLKKEPSGINEGCQYDTTDTIRVSDKEKLIMDKQTNGLASQPSGEKKDLIEEETDDSSCIVDCIYYTMQCAECVIS